MCSRPPATIREAVAPWHSMVVTEGGFFYSPLYSCFEESEAGLEYFDYLTDLAIENDVWGFAFSTYNGPEMPVWWARQKWLTQTNDRFLKGVVKGTEAS